MNQGDAEVSTTPFGNPTHIAIIMDGNGRWASARGFTRIAGQKQGAEAVRSTVRACSDLGISYLTIYAFSSENWKRPATEVDDLMGLLRVYIRRELVSLRGEGVRVRFIGDRSRLDIEINRLISESEEIRAPPPEVVIILFPLNERAAILPKLPHF